MPTPPKPAIVLAYEKKSHRTKAELAAREEQEKSLDTGIAFKERKEVRKNKRAHREFKRVEKLYENLKKNDALFEGSMNRYALLTAECEEFEEKREYFFQSLEDLKQSYSSGESEMNTSEYFKLLCSMENQVLAIDKQIQAKRKMLLDIEKENIMTIAAALRSIPKKPKTEPEEEGADLFGT